MLVMLRFMVKSKGEKMERTITLEILSLWEL